MSNKVKVVISTLKLSELIHIFSEELGSKALVFDYDKAEIITMFVHMDFLNLLILDNLNQKNFENFIHELTIGEYLKKFGKVTPSLNKQLYFLNVN